MMMGAMAGNIAVKGAGLVKLSPGAMVRLRDVDNLRVLATNKGLVLQAGDNGRRTVTMAWKGSQPQCAGKGAAKASAKASKAAAKASKAAAKAAKAKAAAAAAKGTLAPSTSMAASAKSMAVSAKAIAAGTGMTVSPAVAPGAMALTGTTAVKAAGLSLGLGLGLGALGPLLVVGALGVAGFGIYKYGQRGQEEID